MTEEEAIKVLILATQTLIDISYGFNERNPEQLKQMREAIKTTKGRLSK